MFKDTIKKNPKADDSVMEESPIVIADSDEEKNTPNSGKVTRLRVEDKPVMITESGEVIDVDLDESEDEHSAVYDGPEEEEDMDDEFDPDLMIAAKVESTLASKVESTLAAKVESTRSSLEAGEIVDTPEDTQDAKTEEKENEVKLETTMADDIATNLRNLKESALNSMDSSEPGAAALQDDKADDEKKDDEDEKKNATADTVSAESQDTHGEFPLSSSICKPLSFHVQNHVNCFFCLQKRR